MGTCVLHFSGPLLNTKVRKIITEALLNNQRLTVSINNANRLMQHADSSAFTEVGAFERAEVMAFSLAERVPLPAIHLASLKTLKPDTKIRF